MTLFETLKRFVRDRKGVTAVWFGMMVPLVVTSVGLSVDMGQTYLVKERLSRALDAAALAAASMPTDDVQQIEAKINDFLDVNYPDDVIGFQTHIEVNNNLDTLYVEAWAELNPTFMKVFGQDTIQVKAVSEVTKEVKALEVVLVMDVTGSMTTKKNGKTRLKSLQDAANLFLDTMFKPNLDLTKLKIGLVPFSASVNVGRYGLGKTLAGANYGPDVMNNPNNIQWTTPDDNTTAGKKKWKGCVLETTTDHKDEKDHSGKWNMYRYCRNASDTVKCDTTNANADANIGCTKSIVTPLTSSKTDLKASINALVAEGSTYINVGLVWGWRMISRLEPFAEGSVPKDPDWQKAIILMTDGKNEPNGNYSAYGLSSTAGITAGILNTRLANICDDLRDEKILVYTITFDSGVDDDTKELFEECATIPSMAHNAPSDTKLKEVYQKIARELANLHLSK